MRNQFGGHAIQDGQRRRRRPPPTADRAPGARRPPSLHDFRSYRTLEVASARGDRVRRPQRAGQDQPRRGGRLRRGSPRTGSPATRRWSGGRRPGRGPGGVVATAREAVLEVRDQPGPVQPGPGQPVAAAAGPRAGRPGAHGAVLARGPGPGQGRPGRAAPVPRRPAGAAARRGCAGVRSDYDRVLKQRNALLKNAARTAAGQRRHFDSTLTVWDDQLVRLGAELIEVDENGLHMLAGFGARLAVRCGRGRSMRWRWRRCATTTRS